MPRSRAFLLSVSLKIALVALTAFGAFSGLERFDDKGFGWRLLFYPAAVMVLPVVWRLTARGKPFPYAADILITLPFLIDVVGNILGLYDSIDWWDDLNHFVNWALLSGGIGALLLRTDLSARVIAALVIGWGAVAALLWELGEYFAFIRNNANELATAYRDTLGDMTLGTCGAVVAGVATAFVRRRSPA